MKKITSGILVGALALAVIVPSVSYAAADKGTEYTPNFLKRGMHQAFDRGFHGGDKANGEHLMEIVNQYAPELADEFESVFNSLQEKRADRVTPQIDDETKQKLDEIRKQVEEGTLTAAEAKGKMTELGINIPFKGRGDRTPPQLHQQLKEAVDAGDQAKIEELLQQILKNVEDRLEKIQAE